MKQETRRSCSAPLPGSCFLVVALMLAACGSPADKDDAMGSVGSGGVGGTFVSTGGASPGTGGVSAGTGAVNTGTGGASAGSGEAGQGSNTAAGAGGATPTDGGAATGGASGTGADAGEDGPASSDGCGSEGLTSGRASLDVSGTLREYILKMPDGYNATTPYKLIFAWHWRGGNADNVAAGSLGISPYYGLEALAAGSAIFVAPEGIDAGFANTDGRDIAFLRAMLAHFESNLCIDRQRIFSTGFSYGGMMSDAIGCEMADVFRAIAPMSGGLPSAEHDYSGCNEANDHPIAVWMSHGTSDLVVPIADGRNARDLFVARNQCQTQSTAVEPSPCVTYENCATGYPVHWCEFAGGHNAPSFAPTAVWNFFSQF